MSKMKKRLMTLTVALIIFLQASLSVYAVNTVFMVPEISTT